MTLSLCQQTLTIQRIYFILCDQFEFNIIWMRFKTTNFNSIGAHFQSCWTVFVVVFVSSVHAFYQLSDVYN